MVRRSWKEINDRIESIYNYDTFVIKENDFNYLLKLYNFLPVKKDLSFFDKKRKKVVAKFQKDKLIDKYEILFNKDWLFEEAIKTSCNKVIDIMKHYENCYDIYCSYKRFIEKQQKEDKYATIKEYLS